MSKIFIFPDCHLCIYIQSIAYFADVRLCWPVIKSVDSISGGNVSWIWFLVAEDFLWEIYCR